MQTVLKKTLRTAEEMLAFLPEVSVLTVDPQADPVFFGWCQREKEANPRMGTQRWRILKDTGKAHPPCTEGTGEGCIRSELCHPDHFRSCRYQ